MNTNRIKTWCTLLLLVIFIFIWGPVICIVATSSDDNIEADPVSFPSTEYASTDTDTECTTFSRPRYEDRNHTNVSEVSISPETELEQPKLEIIEEQTDEDEIVVESPAVEEDISVPDEPTMAETVVEETSEFSEDRSFVYHEEIPLSEELQSTLWYTCIDNDIPYSLALGLIETESTFNPDADNGLCYGLCQLNKRYFPYGLSPADNIITGMSFLRELFDKYDNDVAAALCAYNAGHDTGSRYYSNLVMERGEQWEDILS